MTLHIALAILLGALAGLAFHRFVGCRSGACPIWANPISSGIYGALLGFLLGTGA
ncbi:MAG: YtxH domain-containing protein [Myxococcales bacterium]|nr:YtxH domain-containing protein [Myxococcales bacterium]